MLPIENKPSNGLKMALNAVFQALARATKHAPAANGEGVQWVGVWLRLKVGQPNGVLEHRHAKFSN